MVALYVAAAVLLLLCAITLTVYAIAFYSPHGRQNDDHNVMRTPQMDPLREQIIGMVDRLNERPFERVTITSDDGLRLCGRYYHQADGAPLAICFHGYRGTPSRDFSGGTAIYFEAGFNLLMVEERAHGGSGGHTITFGVKERYDCLCWIRYAIGRFGEDTRILLCGISMGAATVLMATGLTLPGSVRGVIADAPYTSPKAIIRKVCAQDMGIPAGLAYPFLWLGARVIGGFSLTGADAAQAVKKATVPILLIHGEDDRFVPCDMGREIAESSPDKIEFHTFPDAGHGLSYLVDEPRYTAIVRAFTDRVLGLEPANGR